MNKLGDEGFPLKPNLLEVIHEHLMRSSHKAPSLPT